MGIFHVSLSYRDILILKHSIEIRIENDKVDYELLSKLSDNEITEEGKKFIKDYEQHLKCLENLISEIRHIGYKHGSNIFGKKYI